MKTYKAGDLREDMLVVPVHELESSTPSEDGRELANPLTGAFITGESGNGEYRVVLKFQTLTDMQAAHNYIAQHSRIVAAKDAEIAKFKDANRELAESNVRRRDKIVELMRKLDAQPASQVEAEGPCQKCIAPYDCSIDGCSFDPHRKVAQPARQVGGDEREAFEAWLSSLKFVAGQGQEHVAYCLHRDLGDKYTVEWVSDMWRGWQARAALAPAAVVMPEYERNHAGHIAESALNPWNAALDEVARLNRNPIPVELMRTALFGDEQSAARAANKIRALLGKDGDN